MLNLTHGGVHYACTAEKALAKGVPAAVVHAALRDASLRDVELQTDALRARLVPRRATKIAEYQAKARLADAYADSPTNLTAEVTTNLTAEATAAGMTLPDLMALIAQKSDAFDQAITAVAALEAECEARIAALDLNAADYQQQLEAVITTNTTETATVEASASALI